VAPGNGAPGAEPMADRAPIRTAPLAGLAPADIVALAQREHADLVVIGPEAPLCAGAVDALGAAGIAAFGPSAQAARLEGSKAFLKRFATRHQIPTAPYEIFVEAARAERYIAERGRPVVVKADGLCAGKGAIVTSEPADAIEAVRDLLVRNRFGEAGHPVIVEDRLDGEELSVLALSDGEQLFVLPVARDHKRLSDGDHGPNTGGMGAYAPVPIRAALLERIKREVLERTIDGMRADGVVFRGVLYAGLMIGRDGTPFLLEHNVRFGDPECQALMPLLEGDLGALLGSIAAGHLEPEHVSVAPGRHAVTVVVAAFGYPDQPRPDDRIEGLPAAIAHEFPERGAAVFHAGTRRTADGVLSAGGRVLAVTGVGSSLAAAREQAYQTLATVRFAGMQLRRDIAAGAAASFVAPTARTNGSL
jgi:phosphoribosylamine---glycine ligase